MKTLSISEAKSTLGKIADDVLKGDTILIARKSRYVVLQAYELPVPVPIQPPGYFTDCYTSAAEIKEANKLETQCSTILDT